MQNKLRCRCGAIPQKIAKQDCLMTVAVLVTFPKGQLAKHRQTHFFGYVQNISPADFVVRNASKTIFPAQ